MNTKTETAETGLIGNTNSSTLKKKTITQLKNWCFTFNNYQETDIQEMIKLFNEICTKYVFQEETGENGTPHLQGYIQTIKKSRWTEFKLNKKIHWEPCRYIEKSIEYCQKEETRTGKIYYKGLKLIIPLKIIEKLYPWQKDIEDFILNNKPDGRTLHWRFDTVGNKGKSSFVKYMAVKHRILPIRGGKFADIMNIMFNASMG